MSGAGAFTIKRYFRSGKLYITLNSSVVRDSLRHQKEFLTEKLNSRLAQDEFFSRDDCNASWVEELILK